MAEYTRPYLNIQKGSHPNDQYKSGKAIALLFVLDFLTHQAEGSCVKILNQTEDYLKAELKKLGVQIEVKSDEIKINSMEDIEIRLNMNRDNPENEGTI
jgi:hypothetical protein|tara:strand:- start:191 stop:487 length:297 start_codon:yes stop_codon:yes gene_type:complete